MTDKMNIEPEFVAQMTKTLREILGFTQENLADAAGVSTRTIEKIESGRHKPEIQTLRSIARVASVGVNVFRKLTQAEEDANNAAIERAKLKTVIASVRPIRKPIDFLSAYGEWHARRVDHTNIEQDEALEIAVMIDDWLEDLSMCWDEMSPSGKLDSAKSIASLCTDLEATGYSCCIGAHHQIQRSSDKPILIFQVGVVIFLPHVPDGEERFTLIELEGGWERLEPL